MSESPRASRKDRRKRARAMRVAWNDSELRQPVPTRRDTLEDWFRALIGDGQKMLEPRKIK